MEQHTKNVFTNKLLWSIIVWNIHSPLASGDGQSYSNLRAGRYKSFFLHMTSFFGRNEGCFDK